MNSKSAKALQVAVKEDKLYNKYNKLIEDQ